MVTCCKSNNLCNAHELTILFGMCFGTIGKFNAIKALIYKNEAAGFVAGRTSDRQWAG